MPAQARKRLPRVITTLGLISFFTDIASEMAYPIIPLFLATTLGAPALALGLIEGFGEAVISILRGWAGGASDRMRRRVPFIRWGYALGAAGKPLLALATNVPLVLVARGVDRVGKGVRTPARDAYIADVVDRGMRGSAFGFHRAMDTAGALVGGLVVLGLLWMLPGAYRTIFAIATVPGVIAVVLTLRLREPHHHIVPAPPPAEPAAPPAPAPRTPRLAALRRFPPAYWWTLGLLSVFSLANSSDTFLLLRAQNLGFSDTHVILLYLVFNLVTTAMAWPAGILSDRLGRWRVIGTGWAIYSVVYLGFAWTGATGVWVLFGAYGFFMALTHGVGRALIADHAPADLKGTAMGFFTMTAGFVALAGNIVAGLLWDRIAPEATFLFGGCVAAAGVAAIPLVVARVARAAPAQ